jgi:hypothetical protein
MLSFLFMSFAQAGFGLSMEASQSEYSGEEEANEIAFNSTFDYRTPTYLLQFEALDFARSLAREDEIRGGVNAYFSLGKQRINSGWGGSIQVGLQMDAHNYLLGDQSVTDIQLALAPRMGLELFRSEQKRTKKRYKNTISGGVYLAPHIGIAQVYEQVGHEIKNHFELSVGSQLQLSIWID